MNVTPFLPSNGKGAVSLLAAMLLVCPPGYGEEYYFDADLLKGTAFGQNLARFNQPSLSAGDYLVDIYLNHRLIQSDVRLAFQPAAADGEVAPCLPLALVEKMQIKLTAAQRAQTRCQPLAFWTSAGRWDYDPATLRLAFTLPLSALRRTPRGFIPAAEWDNGVTALFLRHHTSYSWTDNSDAGYRYHYLWSGVTAGSNLAGWQLRHQGNLRYVSSSVSGSRYRYNRVRSWLQRPIASINSQLTAGDSYTDSALFGSLAFNGVKLATDERMWPQGRRGYAPEIRGNALSEARVIVRQHEQIIYETSVPPGPFVIDDLYNTRNQGDLEVEIVEASGKSSTFTVPYASVPDSVRPGNWHYALALGRVRHYYAVENGFFEGVAQRGISNSVTATFGARLAEDYQAWLLGGVWATRAGALGLNSTWSQAKVEQDARKTGWRAELSYSKTFTTGTNLVLSAWRYSTRGYRDLQDVLGVRRQQQAGIHYYSDTLHQRNRLTATLSQSAGELGLVSLSASTADYYNNQSRITQLQLGYSNSWRSLSYGLNVARQRTAWRIGRSRFSVNDSSDTGREQKYTENTLSLNLSVPLDWGNGLASAASNYSQSKRSRASTLSLTGSAGEHRDLSYSLYAGHDRYRDGDDDHATTFGGSLQQNTRVGALRASYGQGESYRQLGLGASGTLLLHRGGVTAGPYTSDTFALIEADGAQGAVVRNGQGAVIDRFGYALLPSLTPYRENSVSLDTLNMRADAELSGGSQRAVPYAGAIGHIRFATLKGKAVLIALSASEGILPPMGAEVRDSEATLIGMVGQGGQLYARVPHDSGTLKVSWDGGACFVRYQLTGRTAAGLIPLNGTCSKE